MTRKRFQKLLMGRFGYSRRDAEDAARRVIEENDSYDDIYYLYLTTLIMQKMFCQELGDAIISMYHKCCGEGRKNEETYKTL